MINKNSHCTSEIIVKKEGYFYLPEINYINFLLVDYCEDCHKMSRISMSCFAAAKHFDRDGSTVSRMKQKEKPKSTKHGNKYEEINTSISLDKYNQKLMNSIWGLYNRNSPHNFKKQNAESLAAVKGQESTRSSFVHFSVPQFNGIFSVSMSVENAEKPKTSLEKFKNLENLFSFPVV